MNNIVKLEAVNIKRLKAIRIEPDGNSMVVIGGRNAQGKTSVIDAIEMALAGKKSVPDRPVRDGEEKAHIICDLGDLVVTRSFRSKNGDVKSTLKVENKDGATYKSPQTILDKLVGQLSFDPLGFCRLEAKEQASTLRNLVGVDTTKLDFQRAEVYRERADINAQVLGKSGAMKNHELYNDVPDEEIGIDSLVDEMDKAQQEHDQYRRSVSKLDDLRTEHDLLTKGLEKKRRELSQIQKDIAELEVRVATTLNEDKSLSRKIDKITIPDMDIIRDKMKNVQNLNEKVRSNIARSELSGEVDTLKTESQKRTNVIKKIDEQKAKMLEATQFPIDGLSFGESGVEYNGIPFSQSSSAEQLKVSLAMGLAMNPKLKVILIRDGSLLDEDSLQVVRDMATDAGAQVWLERVGADDNVSVVIEDGEEMVNNNNIKD